MDDYMFQAYVADCKCVTEQTSYLEIFNYSVSYSGSAFLALTEWLANMFLRIRRSTR